MTIPIKMLAYPDLLLVFLRSQWVHRTHQLAIEIEIKPDALRRWVAYSQFGDRASQAE